jgi:hypothetical protein
MHASTPTKLPLAEWARLLGLDPLHFGQVQIRNQPTVCDAVWLQYEYQASERVGREAVARAIREAEDDIERHLGFRVLPAWEVDERVLMPRALRPENVNLSATDVRGYPNSVKAGWGYFVTGGIRATTLLDADAAIVYTDEDGDDYKETATVTVAVPAGTDPCQVRVYFPGEGALDEWEIRPASVSVAGAVATITFRRELALLPELAEAYPRDDGTPAAADGETDANFLTTVDVYRVYNDPSQQVSFLWEPVGECGCGTPDCSICSYSAQTGCLHLRSAPRLSRIAFSPGDWDADTEAFTSAGWAVGRQPDQARLWYLAGYQDPTLACPRRTLSRDLARSIAIYAASILDRPVCDCASAKAAVDRWRKDLAFVGGADELSEYNVREDDLNNPLGSRAGAVYAWKRVKDLQIGQAAFA